MKRSGRWMLLGLVAFSVTVSIIGVVERFRSNRFDDGIIFPLPFHRAILIASRQSAWTDVLLIGDWPDRRAVAWWGEQSGNGGPSFVWDPTVSWVYGPAWIIQCQGTSPRVAPNGPPAYMWAEARDEWLRSQYPDSWPPPNDLNWIYVSAYKLQFPTLWLASFIVIWMPFLIAVGVRRWIAVRTARRGLCSTCGYDLRATPERCPECGTVPTARKEIASA